MNISQNKSYKKIVGIERLSNPFIPSFGESYFPLCTLSLKSTRIVALVYLVTNFHKFESEHQSLTKKMAVECYLV